MKYLNSLTGQGLSYEIIMYQVTLSLTGNLLQTYKYEWNIVITTPKVDPTTIFHAFKISPLPAHFMHHNICSKPTQPVTFSKTKKHNLTLSETNLLLQSMEYYLQTSFICLRKNVWSWARFGGQVISPQRIPVIVYIYFISKHAAIIREIMSVPHKKTYFTKSCLLIIKYKCLPICDRHNTTTKYNALRNHRTQPR